MANSGLVDIFTAGRSSERIRQPDGSIGWELSPASINRSKATSERFDPHLHQKAIFSGGHPGMDNWPEAEIPPLNLSEGYVMAVPLETRLRLSGWSEAEISEHVKKQGNSNSTFSDVVQAIRSGALIVDDYHGPDARYIEIAAGGLHAARIRSILGKALDLPDSAFLRTDIRDNYGRRATEFHPAESAPIAIAKELAAIALTNQVLKSVEAGNLEELDDAEAQFNEIAADGLLAVASGIVLRR